ncbi:MAG: phosphoethanolamine transferase [Oleispira sp.]|nr:phosphoethanolamine transferase [Oleispira sp.]MBL4880969.1 phosphoethanolamine transferase [Oleispira sp.]
MGSVKGVFFDLNTGKGVLANYAYGNLLYLFMVWYEYLNAGLNPTYNVLFNIKYDLFSYKLYLFCFVVSFLAHNVRMFVTSGIFIGLLFQGLNYTYFGNYIQAASIYQLFFNFTEVVSILFSGTRVLLGSVVILFFFSVFYVILLSMFKSKNIVLNKTSFFVILCLMLSSYFSIHSYMDDGDEKLWQYQAEMILPSYEKSGIENLYIVVRGFVFVFLPKKINSEELFFELDTPLKLKTAGGHNVVLVIGESLRAKQMSLFGYESNTTPKLSGIKSLIYREIYSSGTMTKTSLPALLNRVKYPGASLQIANQKNCLNKLALDQGFNTSFISAQKSIELGILQNLICKKYIENYKDRDDFGPLSKGFDEDLIPYLDVLKNNNQFLVLHMRGSHEPYFYQSPKKFKVFSSEYDNSVYYTDFVVSSMISYIENNINLPTHFIYTSDHGELLGERGVYGHGWFEKEVYEVPLLYASFNIDNDGLTRNRVLNINSHFQLSNFVTTLLGYQIPIEESEDRNIYINGSDIDGLAGYIKINADNVADADVLY